MYFNIRNQKIVYLTLMLAISATIGSLYFSEIKQYAPCILCWFQRIFMYPIVFIIITGIIINDKFLYKYILPMSTTGSFIAFYHVLLQYGVLKETLTSCSFGVSCTTKYVEYFGFVTIPLLSFITFISITICMLLYRKKIKK